jgi:hypothetical protein
MVILKISLRSNLTLINTGGDGGINTTYKYFKNIFFPPHDRNSIAIM